MRNEIFGPVMSVLSFADEEEAIARANDTEFGLGAGIMTENLGSAHRVADRLQAGNVWVNSYNLIHRRSGHLAAQNNQVLAGKGHNLPLKPIPKLKRPSSNYNSM